MLLLVCGSDDLQWLQHGKLLLGDMPEERLADAFKELSEISQQKQEEERREAKERGNNAERGSAKKTKTMKH